MIQSELQKKRDTVGLTAAEQWLYDARRGCIDIHHYYEDAGTRSMVGQGSRSSANPGWDVHLMESFLELEHAYRVRGVTIRPHVMGAIIIASPDVSLWRLILDWVRVRKLARNRRDVREWWKVQA